VPLNNRVRTFEWQGPNGKDDKYDHNTAIIIIIIIKSLNSPFFQIKTGK